MDDRHKGRVPGDATALLLPINFGLVMIEAWPGTPIIAFLRWLGA
jgi:hypothetical protein